MTWRRKPPQCDGCPLYTAHGPVSLSHDGTRVTGDGPRDARVVIVGEAPSDDEVHTNTPFTGPAGRVLNLALSLAGISRKAVFVTNTVRCKTGRKPTRHEIDFCSSRWLWPELAEIAPTTIIPLGETAWSLFSSDPRGIESWRGAIVTRELPCPSPTASPAPPASTSPTMYASPTWLPFSQIAGGHGSPVSVPTTSSPDGSAPPADPLQDSE